MSGCQSNSTDTNTTGEPASVKGENFTFYKSQDMYNDLHKIGREGKEEVGASFEITDVWHSDKDDTKYLQVEVTHKKTCDDQFEIVWDGQIAESYPYHMGFLVKLNTEDCPDLDKTTTDRLSLDLYEALGDQKYLADEEVIFHVYNISSDQSTDYDKPVSNGN